MQRRKFLRRLAEVTSMAVLAATLPVSAVLAPLAVRERVRPPEIVVWFMPDGGKPVRLGVVSGIKFAPNPDNATRFPVRLDVPPPLSGGSLQFDMLVSEQELRALFPSTAQAVDGVAETLNGWTATMRHVKVRDA